MDDRMQTFTPEQLSLLHNTSMQILADVGIAFNEPEALEIFKKHGFKVDDTVVRFSESQIQTAVSSAPSTFTVTARNPEKSVTIGGEHVVFVPGYGAPFVAVADGSQRSATMVDYDNFCKLVQTSTAIDMNGFMMVEPSDVDAAKVHLDMLLSSILLCDKPFMGSPVSKQGAREAVEMATIVWGGSEALAAASPVTVSLINSLSPLQFSDEMAGSLIELARAGQACVVASLIMAGASGPVTLSGVLAVQNAEILAGITLAQLVNPGAPVIYGATSSAMDMKTGGLSIGCPELSKIISATAQMARFYGLPCRSGGGLTDAHVCDAQAGAEGTLALSTAVRNGVNFILHSAGIVGSYIAMSFEKFILDEERCAVLRQLIKPIEVTDGSIDLEMIKSVGIGGQYLTHPKTFELCRTEFHVNELMNRQAHIGWQGGGAKRIDQVAAEHVEKRLAGYTPPDISEDIAQDLKRFVAERKAG